MADVGRILDLLYNAHRRVDEMYLEVRDWRRQDASTVLLQEIDGGGRVRLRWAGGGPYATPAITLRRIWFQPPDRVRVEVLSGATVIRASVRDHDAWWRWDPQGGENVGDRSRGADPPPLLDPPLLHPARLLAGLWFEATGTGSRVGRQVLTATATPRITIDHAVTYYELEIDLANGTPLRIAVFDAEGCVSASDALTIDYEPALDPSIFRFEIRGAEQRTAAGSPRGPSATTNGSNRRVTLPPAVGLASRRTVWLTGLPGAGKTTIAHTVETLLRQLDIACCVIDGDELRAGLSHDLDHSREHRSEQARRAAHIAVLLAQKGVTPIVALVSPYAQDRDRAREIHATAGLGFVEVWVDTPLKICAERDMKGLYAVAQAAPPATSGRGGSNGAGLTGVTAPYEPPANPELSVNGYGTHPRETAARIIELLLSPPAHTIVLPMNAQSDPGARVPTP